MVVGLGVVVGSSYDEHGLSNLGWLFVAGPVSVVLALPAVALGVGAHRRLADERSRAARSLGFGAFAAAVLASIPVTAWLVMLSTMGPV